MTDPQPTLLPLLAKAAAGSDLTSHEAQTAFARIVSGRASPIRTGALLAALQTKGLAPSEVAGVVAALQAAMIPVPAPHPSTLVDTCGTGGGRVSAYDVTPVDFGVETVAPETLAGGEPERNAAVVRAVVEGTERGPARSAVLVNAAAAFQVAGRVDSLAEGAAAAANAIDSGAAGTMLDDLVGASRRAARRS